MVPQTLWILDSLRTSYFQICFKNVPWCSYLSSWSKSYSSPYTITLSIPNWCFLPYSHTIWLTLQISTRWLFPFSLLITVYSGSLWLLSRISTLNRYSKKNYKNKNQEKSPQKSRPLAKVRAIIPLHSFCFAGFHSIPWSSMQTFKFIIIQVLHVANVPCKTPHSYSNRPHDPFSTLHNSKSPYTTKVKETRTITSLLTLHDKDEWFNKHGLANYEGHSTCQLSIQVYLMTHQHVNIKSKFNKARHDSTRQVIMTNHDSSQQTVQDVRAIIQAYCSR